MRSRSIVLAILLASLAHSQGVAQSWVDHARALLGDASTISAARAEVEEHLQKDPNNVDALMMMGNVMYQEFNASDDPAAGHGVLELRSTDDESIYDAAMGFMGSTVTVVPTDVADRMVEQWLKAVAIDPGREDIHKGICHIYSISLQADKLMAYLPVLKEHMAVDAETPYSLANYARNIIDRNEFADGMRVYIRISELFPDCNGMLSDIGGTYYQEGDPVNAKKWIDRAMEGADIDEMSYGNSFFIYAVLEENAKALSALEAACKLNGTKENLLYKGILELAARGHWRTTLNKYASGAGASEEGVTMARTLLNGNPDSTSTYEAVAAAGLNDGFKLPLHHLFRDRIGGFAASFNYAEALGYNHRDQDAVVAFDAIPMEGLSQEQAEKVLFHKAWSVQQTAGVKAALEVWRPLLASSNVLYQSAAAYFIGKEKLRNGDKDGAKELFRSVADSASQNKYAMMCWHLLEV